MYVRTNYRYNFWSSEKLKKSQYRTYSAGTVRQLKSGNKYFFQFLSFVCKCIHSLFQLILSTRVCFEVPSKRVFVQLEVWVSTCITIGRFTLLSNLNITI